MTLRTPLLACLVALALCAPAAHASVAGQIAVAEPGDTVVISEGSADPLVIDKPLTLTGSGVPEITGGITVTASDVTIEGLTISGAAGPGLTLSGGGTGRVIRDNVIEGNGFGIYANGEALITGNVIRANNDVNVPAGGNGIYSDQGASGLVIHGNTFEGPHSNGSITLVGADPAAQEGIEITDNDLGDNLVFMLNTSGALVEGNTSVDSVTHGIQLGGGNRGTRIEGNTIESPDWSAVRVTSFGVANRDVEVVGNHLTGANDYGLKTSDGAHDGRLHMRFNRIAGNLTAGVQNDDADSLDSIRAEDNWWGCNEIGCDTASAGVDDSPRLVLSLVSSRAEIGTGGDATDLTASLRRNSAGDTFATLPLPPFPVGFATTLGSVDDPATAAGGAATTVLRSGSEAGTATATATLDAQPVTRTLTITAPPAQQQQQQVLPDRGPPPDTTGPQIAVVRRTLRVSSAREFSVDLFCPREEADGCTGSLHVASSKAVRVAARKRKVTFATKSFTLPAGQMSPVTLKLSKKNGKLLERLRRVPVTVTVLAGDAVGNQTRVVLGMTLVAPPRKRR